MNEIKGKGMDITNKKRRLEMDFNIGQQEINELMELGYEKWQQKSEKTINQPHNIEGYWFLKNRTRQEAEELLAGAPTGTFLIRARSAGHYALSIVCRNQINHCIIYETESGYGFAAPYNIYLTLKKLVEHYSTNSLEEHNDTLTTTLRIPVLYWKNNREVIMRQLQDEFDAEMDQQRQQLALEMQQQQQQQEQHQHQHQHQQHALQQHHLQNDGSDHLNMPPPPPPPPSLDAHEVLADTHDFEGRLLQQQQQQQLPTTYFSGVATIVPANALLNDDDVDNEHQYHHHHHHHHHAYSASDAAEQQENIPPLNTMTTASASTAPTYPYAAGQQQQQQQKQTTPQQQ